MHLSYRQVPMTLPLHPIPEHPQTSCDQVISDLLRMLRRSRSLTASTSHLRSSFLLISSHRWSKMPFTLSTTATTRRTVLSSCKTLMSMPSLPSTKASQALIHIAHLISPVVLHAAHQAHVRLVQSTNSGADLQTRAESTPPLGTTVLLKHEQRRRERMLRSTNGSIRGAMSNRHAGSGDVEWSEGRATC